MNKKTLVLGVIVGILVCYAIFMGYYFLKPEEKVVAEKKTYEYVLINKDMKKYDKVTCNDITRINTQDDTIGEIKLSRSISSDLLDISSNEIYYLSKDINKYSILQDDYLLTSDEVINSKKEYAQSLDMKILELESMNQKQEEGFEVSDNLKTNYENILNNFDITKDMSVTITALDKTAKAKLIEITKDHVLLALNEDDYEYFQSIKDTEIISVKLDYN